MKPALALITLLIIGLYVASLCDNWQFDKETSRHATCGKPCYAYEETR